MGQLRPIKANDRTSLGFSTLALTLLASPDGVRSLGELVATESESRSYPFDLLLKAFDRDFPMASKYKVDKVAAPWADPVLRAIAEPLGRRAAVLEAYMKNWCRIMRPWGWKPNLDTAPGKDDLFCDFAFEVALAVCAWDIDDSGFSAHPYYPRDLVAYYRTNLRHSRDAWRADKAGPGIAVKAPPLPAKAELGKSKRKGIERWVELVCDGNVDATEAVLETVGKPRIIKELGELMGALFEQSQVVLADIKDDDTVAICCATAAATRGLGDFDAPTGPPFGLTGSAATLLAFSEWLKGRGYRLVDLATTTTFGAPSSSRPSTSKSCWTLGVNWAWLRAIRLPRTKIDSAGASAVRIILEEDARPASQYARRNPGDGAVQRFHFLKRTYAL